MSNNKVLFWSFTVALGGFLFGFDTAVISGGEQAIQKLWSLSDAMIGQMVAMALYGTVIGALIGGIPADKLGRKVTLFLGLVEESFIFGSEFTAQGSTLGVSFLFGTLQTLGSHQPSVFGRRRRGKK